MCTHEAKLCLVSVKKRRILEDRQRQSMDKLNTKEEKLSEAAAERPRLTLEAMSQEAAPQHPGVEAERVPMLRAEEALGGDL